MDSHVTLSKIRDLAMVVDGKSVASLFLLLLVCV